MPKDKEYSKASVIIVGAGPAGLATGISLKIQRPELDICIIEKAANSGGHNLSGAVLEAAPLEKLLNKTQSDWRDSDQAKKVLARKVEHDDIRFLLGKKAAIPLSWSVSIAKMLRLGFGQMVHKGDYIVSASQLVSWLSDIARNLGVEIITGFAVSDILVDEKTGHATAVKTVDQGLDAEGNPQENFVPGETLQADIIVLAEGADGLVTEKFVKKAGLVRKNSPLFSVGVKQLIEVSPQQYQLFGDNRVVHAMGYPIWTPVLGPAMFGGGILYAMGENRIAAGMIVGADWKECNFNPEDALELFKQHPFVKQFIDGGTIIETGAKMIPEGGYYAVPRDRKTNNIGQANVIIVGDSAGFVNMLKIKGMHNAIISGMTAAQAANECLNESAPQRAAERYTRLLENTTVEKEMQSARNYRQTVAKFGPLIGLPLSTITSQLGHFEVERDYQAMTTKRYEMAPEKPFDKDAFTALAEVEHREEQPCHLKILDPQICIDKCQPRYGNICKPYDVPCVAFCPAGVYEVIHGTPKPANPSNCLHCKTCQNKCPYDNIRWEAPEGSGGPNYHNM